MALRVRRFVASLVSAGSAYRMHGRHLQMAVLRGILLHSRVSRGILGVFLHVVKLLMGDNPGRCDRLAYVFGKRHAAVAAVKFPSAAVSSGQKILVAAFAFGEAAG